MKMKLKKNGLLIFLVIIGLMFMMVEAIYAADLENKVVVRTEADATLASMLEKSFEQKYPGVDAVIITMGSSDSFVKSFTEFPNVQADILTTKKYYFIKGIKDSMKKFGEAMFMPYKSPMRVNQIPDLVDKEGYYQVERWAARAIICNEDAAKKFGVPKGLNDLLTWEGKFDFADPIQYGSGFSFLQTVIQDIGGYENPMPGIEYMKKLYKAHDIKNAATSVLTQMLETGEIDAMWNFDIFLYRLREKGVLVEASYPEEGTVISCNCVGILANCQHPNAAKAWIDFVLSENTQKMITEQTYYRTPGKNIELPQAMRKYIIPNADKINFNIPDELVAEKTNEWKRIFEDNVF